MHIMHSIPLSKIFFMVHTPCAVHARNEKKKWRVQSGQEKEEENCRYTIKP
jgi:hypothetical protein